MVNILEETLIFSPSPLLCKMIILQLDLGLPGSKSFSSTLFMTSLFPLTVSSLTAKRRSTRLNTRSGSEDNQQDCVICHGFEDDQESLKCSNCKTVGKNHQTENVYPTEMASKFV